MEPAPKKKTATAPKAAEPKPKPAAEPKPKPAAEPKPKVAAEPKPKAAAEPKPKAAAEPEPTLEFDIEDDTDDDGDSVLDFDNLTDNESSEDDEDDDVDDEADVEVATATDDVFDLDKFKKGSVFNQEEAEKAFLVWKANRARKPASWYKDINVPSVDESQFKESRRVMTQRLIDSYKVKLAKIESALAEPDKLSKAELKELKVLQRQYQDNISSRQKEL